MSGLHNIEQLGSAESESSTSDEGEYDTKMETPYGNGKEERGRRKVCSLPELSSSPALNGHTTVNGNQCYYALEIAFRSRKSVCVETIEYLQVFSLPHNHNCQGLVKSRPKLKSSAK